MWWRDIGLDWNMYLSSVMVNSLIFLFISVPILSFGQSAKFYADTSRLMEYNGHGTSSLSYGMQMQWIIKGKTMHWGSLPIEVTLSALGIDTIFFSHHDGAKWDTMICKMQANTSIRFVYNPCCDYFDVEDKPDNRTEAKVSSQLIGSKRKSEKYLGTIDDTGILLSAKPVIISPVLRSPMFPNNYNVAINMIGKCSRKDCRTAVLLKDDQEMDISYKYKILKTLTNIHYIQLGTEPILLSLNVDTGIVEIR